MTDAPGLKFAPVSLTWTLVPLVACAGLIHTTLGGEWVVGG